jgi:hypothetical protein
MILMWANPLLGPLEGEGPENLYFFGPKYHSRLSLPFQGPKKSRFSVPTPSNALRNGYMAASKSLRPTSYKQEVH